MSIAKLNILDKGVDLSRIGINDYAYSWENIDVILAEIKKLNLTILGGDIYTIKDGELILTFDNWYYNQSNSNSSIVKAREYLYDYLEKNEGNFYFSLVFK
ncbi:Imm40 family immunity protein [Streptococcus suis]|uniref:Imm40 family immunity protein n=1 Tax=Streptococcus suis TaxID=1307 RepID=UPI0004138CF3|nr:Imm40 family immunity protein [Streptococcus suis]MBO4134254.1 hypothetical protein [Streptococcus suis]MCO8183910.1 Imm40 family immunity protein [Streptococcus suis]MCO8215477.1 Imm40 family immunity protein [Streptococcus suis]NQG76618.1 hypothetical protein [Streptococcus suis]NQK13585.1 hypothetical protein [Streptococcus suis]